VEQLYRILVRDLALFECILSSANHSFPPKCPPYRCPTVDNSFFLRPVRNLLCSPPPYPFSRLREHPVCPALFFTVCQFPFLMSSFSPPEGFSPFLPPFCEVNYFLYLLPFFSLLLKSLNGRKTLYRFWLSRSDVFSSFLSSTIF